MERDLTTHVNFNSIAFPLQVKIAEMMSYWDQMHCRLSSKHGRNIVNSTKRRAVVFVDCLSAFYGQDIQIYPRAAPFRENGKMIWWEQLRQVSELPRFKLRYLYIDKKRSLRDISEIEEKAGFIKSELELDCHLGLQNSVQLFNELTETFSITTFKGKCCDPSFCYLPKFQEISCFHLFHATNFSDEALMKLKATEISFSSGATSSTVNCFLKQWLRKERDIKWLTASGLTEPLEKESIFLDIPFCLFYQWKKWTEKHFWFWLNGRRMTLTLHNGDFICGVNRGDKKLLVVCGRSLNGISKGQVYIQEYDVLEDIFCWNYERMSYL